MTEIQAYIMPVKAIKHILKTELEEFKTDTLRLLHNNYIMADAIYEIVSDGFDAKITKLESLVLYQELDDFISECGYRMSLQEWIDSL